MPKMLQVTVNGHTYNTISEAWRAESPAGLPEITVRKRLEMGWAEDDAFSLPAVEPSDRRGNKLSRLTNG